MSPEAIHKLSIADLLRAERQTQLGTYQITRDTALPRVVIDPSGYRTKVNLLNRSQDVLRLIASLRTLSQRIYRLPPEVLSRVAEYVINDFGPEARPIVPLVHVCRDRRESIISTPERWARISCGSDKMAVVSLERAKAVPLVVSLFVPVTKRRTSFPDILVP